MPLVAAGARAVRDIVARCHAGLDAPALLADIAARIDAVVPVDAVFCASVDPATLLFTGAVSREIPDDLAARFLTN